MGAMAATRLRGRALVGIGTGPGLSPISWGQQGGKESVALQAAQIPPHTHMFSGTVKTGAGAELPSPNGVFPAVGPATQFSSGTPTTPMNPSTLSGQLGNTGGSQPHENRQPTLVMNYAIAVTGLFPPRQ